MAVADTATKLSLSPHGPSSVNVLEKHTLILPPTCHHRTRSTNPSDTIWVSISQKTGLPKTLQPQDLFPRSRQWVLVSSMNSSSAEGDFRRVFPLGVASVLIRSDCVFQDPALHRFRCNRDLYLSNILQHDGFIWTEGGEVIVGVGWQQVETSRLSSAVNPVMAMSYYVANALLAATRVTLSIGLKYFFYSVVHAHEIADAHQQWNGQYFVSCTLKSLGLRFQLGHRPGERCLEPAPIHSSFVVLHTNRIHDVAVDACDCEQHLLWAGPPEEQMLRAVLDTFLLQTYQAKTTMYDYYSVLEKLTSNVGVKPPNCYHAFLRMVREYSHLLMLKRAGCGHAKSGVLGTAQGELVVLYPCCPIPSINLPEGWKNAPSGQQ
ncbi:hypothetical protein B0H14DRAFT_3519239 [Mycena olivaceomarginata]|nr:hypothetical protein B0H14DRAFT_3519239 [Mycena olivaceomarginata]